MPYVPATLLTEPLFNALYGDTWRLGVKLAHLVPPVVLLRVRERPVTSLHLAPGDRSWRQWQLLVPFCHVDFWRLLLLRVGWPLAQLKTG